MNGGHERRIGVRHQLELPIAVAAISSSRWRRPKPLELTTVNLSLSGAGFVCDAIPEIRAHSLINVTIAGVTGPAVVRSVRPQEPKPSTYYGIEFSDPRVGDAVRDLITEKVELVRTVLAPESASETDAPETETVEAEAPVALPRDANSKSPYRPDFSDWY